MKPQIITKKTKNLTDKEIFIMNNARIKEYGKQEKLDFKKADSNGEFIFVKDNGELVAFGMMKPVNVELDNKKYVIYGIGRGLALEKGKGWGRTLNEARILKLKRLGKTGVAFTSGHNIGFFKKVGYKIKKKGIRKFLYKNQKGELIEDNDGEMVYYEGKDKFVTKLLKSKNKAIMDSDFW
jgi:predicted N-acetyltransferase YhbS